MNEQDLEAHRAAWQHRGQERPGFAVAPGPGQESVWDYPRPPAYVHDDRPVQIVAGGWRLADSPESIRVLETGSPPAFYLPPGAFDQSLLRASPRHTFCEWKGEADYFDVVTDEIVVEAAVWTYPAPMSGAEVIAGWLSCYPEVLECVVAGETVQAQGGRYYGGWVTSELVGPWKGEAGTEHW